jgi:hypothetical protein
MSGELILMVDDAGAIRCETLDGPDGDGTPLDRLIDDWVATESLDDKLHPHLDDTLWVLKGLNDMMIRIIGHFEDDDPHRDVLLDMHKTARNYVDIILVALNGDDVQP